MKDAVKYALRLAKTPKRRPYATAGSVEGDVQFAPDDVKFEDKDKVAPPAPPPMMAQNEYSMHLPQQEVKYDTGPQPGEQTLKAYEPTTREQIAQTMMGDQAPSPERRHFVEGMMGTSGLGHQGMGVADFVPVAGQALQAQEAYQHKDPKEFLLATVPVPGANIESKLAQAGRTAVETAAPVVQHAAEQVVEAIAPQLTKKQSQSAAKAAWEENPDPNFNSWQHKWNVEEGPKYRAAQTPAVESGPVVQKKPTGFQLPDPYERVTNPAGFYSHGAEAARALPQQKGTLEQMISALKGYGVRPEEIRWSGVEQAFANRPHVTGEELAQHFEQRLPQVSRITKDSNFDVDEYDLSDIASEEFDRIYRDEFDDDLARELEDHDLENMSDRERERLEERIGDQITEGYWERAYEDAQQTAREQAEERGPKWGGTQYNFPGGEDYFENILTIPHRDMSGIHPNVMDYATEKELKELEKAKTQASINYDNIQYKINNELKSFNEKNIDTLANQQMEKLKASGHQFSTDDELREARQRQAEAEDAYYKARSEWKSVLREPVSVIDEVTGTTVANPNGSPAREQELKDIMDQAQEAQRKAYDDYMAVKGNNYNNYYYNLIDSLRSQYVPEDLAAQLGNLDEYKAIEQSPEAAEAYKKLYAARRDYEDLEGQLLEASKEHWSQYPEYENEFYQHRTHLGDITNPILHGRFQTHEVPDPETGEMLRVLNESESQSDWSKENFARPLNEKEQQEVSDLANIPAKERTPEQNLRLSELLSSQSSPGKTKEVPYVGKLKHWAELSAKDALAHAIENDFDRIFITGGQEQAKRWSSGIRSAAEHISWRTKSDVDSYEMPAKVLEPYSHAMFGKQYYDLTDEERGLLRRDVSLINLGRKENLFPGDIHAIPDAGKVVKIRMADGSNAKLIVKSIKQPNGQMKNIVVESNKPQTVGENLSAVVGSDLEKQIMSSDEDHKDLSNYMMGAAGYEHIYDKEKPDAYRRIIKSLDAKAKVEPGTMPTPKDTGRNGMQPYEVRDIAFHMKPEEEAKFGEQMKSLLGLLESSTYPQGAYVQWMRHHATPEFKIFMRQFENENRQGTWVHITPKMKEEYRRLKQKYGAVFPAYKRGGAVDTSHLSKITDRGLKAARRAAFADGGKTMIKRKAYEPVRGLKITPPAEELSKEPDIRAYQMARHAHEFIGSPEPDVPRRPVVLDAPLFGGKHELFSVPYTYHPTIQKALNLAYGQKTLPLYMHPASSTVGRALDAYEAAKFIQRDPTNPLSYTGVPGTLWGATKSALPAVATGAYVARDEAETPKSVQNSPQSMENFTFDSAPEVISHPKSEKLPLRDEEALHFDEGGAVPTDLPMMAQQDPNQNIHDTLVGQRANEEQSLREASQQPMNPGLKTAVDFATYSMATPDTAPQRIAKTAVETPDIAKNFAQSQYQGVKNAGQYFVDTMSGRKPMDVTSPEAIQSANTIAGLVGTGGMSVGEAPAGSLGMFVGRNAQFRPAEQAMFDEGERRLLAGHDPREVHATTNVHPIHGGEPAFEISDYPSQFHPDKFNISSYPFHENGQRVFRDAPVSAKLPDVLTHDELYEKYPDLKKLDVYVLHNDPEYAAFNAAKAGRPAHIALGSKYLGDIDKGREALLHELQHAIQTYEDWPVGGDPNDPLLHQIPFGATGKERMESRLNDKYYSPLEAYFLTAGERQAYNVEKRLGLTPENLSDPEVRAQVYPLDTEPQYYLNQRKPNPNEILIRRTYDPKYTPLDLYMRNKPRYAQGGAVENALRLAKSKKNKVY